MLFKGNPIHKMYSCLKRLSWNCHKIVHFQLVPFAFPFVLEDRLMFFFLLEQLFKNWLHKNSSGIIFYFNGTNQKILISNMCYQYNFFITLPNEASSSLHLIVFTVIDLICIIKKRENFVLMTNCWIPLYKGDVSWNSALFLRKGVGFFPMKKDKLVK